MLGGIIACHGCWCYLILTKRARAGTLSRRVKDATRGVAAVGALPLGFQVKLGLVRGISASSLSAYRAAIVRSVGSSKMPLANTPVVHNLLDAPVGVDPAVHIIWTRFRMMRRCLANLLEEVPRVFRTLDLVTHGADGHGLVHLLLVSVAELGFAWDGRERGWIRAALPPLEA